MITDRYIVDDYDLMALEECYGHGDMTLSQAIQMVDQERCKLYVIPCEWYAKYLDDGTILVQRFRNDSTRTKRKPKVE
jgi:hypothetical protein